MLIFKQILCEDVVLNHGRLPFADLKIGIKELDLMGPATEQIFITIENVIPGHVSTMKDAPKQKILDQVLQNCYLDLRDKCSIVAKKRKVQLNTEFNQALRKMATFLPTVCDKSRIEKMTNFDSFGDTVLSVLSKYSAHWIFVDHDKNTTKSPIKRKLNEKEISGKKKKF